ncbi:hypothetical protein COV16_06505 [Candidatus Woesearchaeota archaeon CG10_big_fil_rev_8_21_14_0_10_34_8]|nr:MAG: hypothetical protein COV16_06505 [Candidatus Woesearchaeota archaeon CG10_big_fil_rev_8_21_14_0_10_34_8]
MSKSTTLEKIVVNVFTPVEYLNQVLIPAAYFMCTCRRSILKKYLTEEPREKENSFSYKIRVYERLLDSLETCYDEKHVGRYMVSICGRIQVRLAMHYRKMLTMDEYRDLAERNPLLPLFQNR